ncbi:MAG: [CysO sulfur-carrier protein]-S-L-cysteine hydrolase [Acidobacteriota bacterium]|jgi:proteasome lid subunit RPN8/RPN11|nr:[CysO sulfur-carrier protein]-S-L-cysteine hydrolase [Acidobacteriota bacterium]
MATDFSPTPNPQLPTPILLLREHLDEMLAHAREQSPAECCGLVGGKDERVRAIYRLRNAARDPLVGYEAAPEELFAAQRRMRERGEELLGIYHSHPRAKEPVPSETDVRLAYYPSAIYFIIGLGAGASNLRAFRISERDASWEQVEYAVADSPENA